MSFTAVVLLVLSSFTHAGWNLLGKRSRSNVAAFLVASGSGVMLLLPFVLVFRGAVVYFTTDVWLLLIAAGFFQALYYASLSAAYRRGDMSLVYPVARSSPAIFVALFGLIVGRGGQISGQAFAGITLILAGGFLLPMRHFADFSLRKYLALAFGFALVAALGTTGYSIVDDRALRIVWGDPSLPYSQWQVAAVYAFFEAATSTLWLSACVLLHPRERAGFFRREGRSRASLGSAVLMGFGIYLTYTIVLVSMAFVSDVSYVVAFRQLSIPLGVLLSAILLRERLYLPRFAGAALMFVGVVLVGMG